MISFLKKILVIAASFTFISCAAKNECNIKGAVISGISKTELNITFEGKGECSYMPIKRSPYEWVIEIPNAVFEDFKPEIKDSFSSFMLASGGAENNFYRLAFNEGVKISLSKDGRNNVMNIKRDEEDKGGTALNLLSASCSDNGMPYLLKAVLDGYAAYKYGIIKKGKTAYLDIYNVKISDAFSFTDCKGTASVSSLNFPNRVRFLINSKYADVMKPSIENGILTLSRYDKENSPKIIRAEESEENGVQTVKIFTTSPVEYTLESNAAGYIAVALNKGVKSSGKRVFNMSGEYISQVLIDDKADIPAVIFKFRKEKDNLDVYLNKTSYGFVLYSKKAKVKKN